MQLQHQTQLDPTEDIQVVLIPLAEVIDAIATQKIQVAGTIAAIFLAWEYLQSKKTQ